MFSSFNISASGMTAQKARMDIIANNIANVETTNTGKGEPYRRKMPVFRAREEKAFSKLLKDEMGTGIETGDGVVISGVIEDQKPFKMVYNPTHPDANPNGYVAMPNVDVTTEMVDMIDASRSYEANVTALNTFKNMAMKALEIGRG